MTNLEIINLPANAKVRIKKHIECADCYKKVCLLAWYDSNKKGRTEINRDTGELEITYPFGIKTADGVCYQFPAEAYELA
jgi:hypothetical protein